MATLKERYLWAVVFAVLVVFSVPWFLWQHDLVIAGLPIWIWWHVGWMVVTALVFVLFTRHGWGVWIEHQNQADPVAQSPTEESP